MCSVLAEGAETAANYPGGRGSCSQRPSRRCRCAHVCRGRVGHSGLVSSGPPEPLGSAVSGGARPGSGQQRAASARARRPQDLRVSVGAGQQPAVALHKVSARTVPGVHGGLAAVRHCAARRPRAAHQGRAQQTTWQLLVRGRLGCCTWRGGPGAGPVIRCVLGFPGI